MILRIGIFLHLGIYAVAIVVYVAFALVMMTYVALSSDLVICEIENDNFVFPSCPDLLKEAE